MAAITLAVPLSADCFQCQQEPDMACELVVQVYGIISAQLVLTAVVAATILAVPPVRGFVTTSVWFQITCGLAPLIGARPPS